ncbi:dihydrofolate reductase [Paenibacillus sp. MBLB4367]|uniref:dihydrofolate reductase n=1 Tax=Paenibacillus sp. MBLB4367 TaxID=3384767 RepID=UPI0039083F84
MIISLIAAVAQNHVIGMDAAIPWKIPGEQKRFKGLTMGKPVIMGRKTFESIGKPLPGRKTVIVSGRGRIEAEGCTTVASLEDAYELLKEEEEVFIAGGGEIYRLALPHADKIYLTLIDREIEGNITFPEFDKDRFAVTYEERVAASIPYTYFTYERKNGA